MNIVYRFIKPGLKAWSEKGAKIRFLRKEDTSVPLIWLRTGNQTKNTLLLASGLHLEETSGPIFLLNPSLSYTTIKKLSERVNILIFPVINQWGLKFDENGSDHKLRHNGRGLNYNSFWGIKTEKCLEVSLVESYIYKIIKKFNLVFVLSMHEDSTEPGRAYMWMNQIHKNQRRAIQSSLRKTVDKKILGVSSKSGLESGFYEGNFTIVNSKDDSFENFMSDILGVPTILSEAPFGLKLKQRTDFHHSVLKSIPVALCEG